MASGYLTELQAKHTALDAEIIRLSNGRVTDNLGLARLKREKLKLKDRMARY